MNQKFVTWIGVGTAAAALLVGCSHKTDAKTELEKAANALAQGDNTPPPPAPAPVAQPAPAEASPPAAEPAAPPPVPASQQMQEAMTFYKTGQLEDAVKRLQKLRATPTLTPQQRMAVQDGVAAVMNEIYEMAAKGDTRAIAAVRQYEEMNSRPR